MENQDSLFIFWSLIYKADYKNLDRACSFRIPLLNSCNLNKKLYYMLTIFSKMLKPNNQINKHFWKQKMHCVSVAWLLQAKRISKKILVLLSWCIFGFKKYLHKFSYIFIFWWSENKKVTHYTTTKLAKQTCQNKEFQLTSTFSFLLDLFPPW